MQPSPESKDAGTASSKRVYEVDDIFHLAAQEPHSEFYGMFGVQYLVGRKTPPAA